MRLVMFHPTDHPLKRGWVGRLEDEHVIQLAAQTLQAFFTGGGSAREHAVYPLPEVHLLAPVLHPPAVRVFDSQDSFAFANPAAIVGPGARVAAAPVQVGPRLAAVIGAGGALGGFTAFADWRRPDVAPPKDRDFALGLGPVVVTPDELEAKGREAIVRVDGVESLRGRFEGFDWAAARDHAAEHTALPAGDVLAGPALGFVAVEPGRSFEVEIDGIGVLAQTAAR
jgi:Fumarylacetoacetate (FAA) hydrolase family